MNLASKLDRISARAEELRDQLTQGLSGDAYVKASKELSDIEPVVARIGDLRAAERAQAEAETLLADPEMHELAEAELRALKEQIPSLQHEIRLALLPNDAADERADGADAPACARRRYRGGWSGAHAIGPAEGNRAGRIGQDQGPGASGRHRRPPRHRSTSARNPSSCATAMAATPSARARCWPGG